MYDKVYDNKAFAKEYYTDKGPALMGTHLSTGSS